MKQLFSFILLAFAPGVFSQTPISQPVKSSGLPAVSPDASIFFTTGTLMINIEEFIQGDGNDLSPTYVNNIAGKSTSVAYVKEFTENKFEVKIAPNPTFDWITFEVPKVDIGNYTFQLIDITGDVVVEFEELSVKKVTFNTQFIHNGTYLVRIEQESTRDWSMYKIIKAQSE